MVMDGLEDYIKNAVKNNDKGSKRLAAHCASTLRNNSDLIDIIRSGMNGLAVFRVPKDYLVVVHSAAGNPEEKDLSLHAASMVDNLYNQAMAIGAIPKVFADVIDAKKSDIEPLDIIAEALVRKANEYNLSIMNGEFAVLGDRVNCQANVSGTMISIIHKDDFKRDLGLFIQGGVRYSAFDPEGKPVVINSDGIGTKTEFYERILRYAFGVRDFMAMNLDDASKIGAIAKVISGVIETSGVIPVEDVETELFEIAKRMGIIGSLQHEDVGDRIKGYADGKPTYNVSGSVVSVIDEEKLANPLKPKKGEYLIAIRSKPNPRSNGITDRRRFEVEMHGENYHETPEGKKDLEYLATPSTILYPVFSELIDKGIATSVYHLSGGSYNGKLARPLAKHNLFVELKNLFEPPEVDLKMMKHANISVKSAYQTWPMGTDGFITTSNPEEAIRLLNEMGLEAREVGVLEYDALGKTGVMTRAFNGELVYYDGRD